jgi:hypothetical protein
VSRYRTLALVVLGAAAALALAWRMPKRAPAPAAVAAPAPSVALEVGFADGVVTPELASVPKDRRVRLTLVNHGSRTLAVRLAGYEDRVAADSLAAGATWRCEFLADRPGEGFPWLVDGAPRGRLVVAGSHLAEGHR